jgi:predicted acetyltransferase
MVFRQAYNKEINQLFRDGYEVWSRNRSFEQYCIDNSKEDNYGTRYVIDLNEQVVSSLILLKLNNILNKNVYGIGSVLTLPAFKKRGFAAKLLKNCINLVYDDDTILFLYSEIKPSFYERFNFRELPVHLQKDSESICMVLCNDDIWDKLIDSSIEIIPDHF